MVLAGQFGGSKPDSKKNAADGTSQPTFHSGSCLASDQQMPQGGVFAEVLQGP
jgi:hypothetical protein